jgi:hypothetical protein
MKNTFQSSVYSSLEYFSFLLCFTCLFLMIFVPVFCYWKYFSTSSWDNCTRSYKFILYDISLFIHVIMVLYLMVINIKRPKSNPSVTVFTVCLQGEVQCHCAYTSHHKNIWVCTDEVLCILNIITRRRWVINLCYNCFTPWVWMLYRRDNNPTLPRNGNSSCPAHCHSFDWAILAISTCLYVTFVCFSVSVCKNMNRLWWHLFTQE